MNYKALTVFTHPNNFYLINLSQLKLNSLLVCVYLRIFASKLLILFPNDGSRENTTVDRGSVLIVCFFAITLFANNYSTNFKILCNGCVVRAFLNVKINQLSSR